MIDPELWIAIRPVILLQPGDRHPYIVEQRGPIDLVREILDFQLLDRGGGGSECGHVLPNRVAVEAAQSPTGRNEAGGVRRRRIEVPQQVSVGLAESVQLAHQECCPAATSEWSPRVTLPVSPSTRTLLPIKAPSRLTLRSVVSRPTIALARVLSVILVPRSNDTLGPTVLRSMVTPSSM